jgi:hypothetical protein
MGSVAIVVIDELGQHRARVTLADQHQVIEAFGPNGPHDPLRDRVGGRCPLRGPHPGDPQTGQPAVEVAAVDGIPVVEEVLRLPAPGRRLQELVPDPGRGRTAVTLKWTSSRRSWRMKKKT